MNSEHQIPHTMKHTLLVLALIATQAQAQIIYTDVIPDATYSDINDSCYLDLDNDGNTDFLIVQRTLIAPCPGGDHPECAATNTRPRSWVKITPQGTNTVAITAPYASQLPPWNAIDPALTWNHAGNRILLTQDPPFCMSLEGQIFMCVAGNFTGSWSYGASETSPKFLGLRFDIAGSTFYGWARLSIPIDGSSFTLKDYAYNSVPGGAILAGDDGSLSGITSSALRGMQVMPNPFSSALSISLPTGTTGSVSCRVLSLVGQALLTRTIAPTSGPSVITLDLASLAPGAYLLEMQTGGERIVRKVVKL